jgi:predicted dehydrogenase
VSQGSPTRVAVVGAGYWGINHVRTVAQEPAAELAAVCDSSEAARVRAKEIAPTARLTDDLDSVLGDDGIDAVIIATPAVTHADIACAALEAGKHVLVEKPLALTVPDAERVRSAAEASSTVAMVGHLMVYHSATERLRELIVSGALGEIYYLYARRVNLGRLRRDENALWSFGPHDVSMVDYLLDEPPVSVAAWGRSCLQKGVEDVVFVTLELAGGQVVHIHLSWLNPRKERLLTVVGSRKMVEFDDVSQEKLKIYDKGYEIPPEFTHFDEFLTIRHGDIHIPHLTMREPLAVECRHFLDCIDGSQTPRTGVDSGVRVTQVLAAAQESLERDGRPVMLPRD